MNTLSRMSMYGAITALIILSGCIVPVGRGHGDEGNRHGDRGGEHRDRDDRRDNDHRGDRPCNDRDDRDCRDRIR